MCGGLNIFEDRRSVNFFDKEQQLSNETLKDIVNMAVLAPSAFNLQPWDIIAVKSMESKQKLYNLCFQQPKVLEAPVTLIVIGDRDGYKENNPQWQELFKLMGKEGLEKAQGFASLLYGSTEDRKTKFAQSNAGLLAMSIMYAAKFHGVDSHPMSGVDFEGVKAEFGITDNKEVVMLITLGHFDNTKTLYPRAKRRGYDELVKEV